MIIIDVLNVARSGASSFNRKNWRNETTGETAALVEVLLDGLCNCSDAAREKIPSRKFGMTIGTGMAKCASGERLLLALIFDIRPDSTDLHKERRFHSLVEPKHKASSYCQYQTYNSPERVGLLAKTHLNCWIYKLELPVDTVALRCQKWIKLGNSNSQCDCQFNHMRLFTPFIVS